MAGAQDLQSRKPLSGSVVEALFFVSNAIGVLFPFSFFVFIFQDLQNRKPLSGSVVGDSGQGRLAIITTVSLLLLLLRR